MIQAIIVLVLFVVALVFLYRKLFTASANDGKCEACLPKGKVK